jgi:hypothetical protein
MIKIFSNQTNSLEGGLALTEDKLKEQVASLELGTMLSRSSPTRPIHWKAVWP